MRSDRERLRDILEAIAAIEKYAIQGKEAFEGEELIRTWIATHLQIIGEASSSLSQGLKSKYSDIPWNDIVGMRHILVHHYFKMNYKVLWATVVNDLPPFKTRVEAMLNELRSSTPPPSANTPDA